MNIIYIILASSSLVLVSCQNKQPQLENKSEDKKGISYVELKETLIVPKADSIEYMPTEHLTSEEYDNLQLSRVKDLEGYHLSDLRMGRTLLSNDNGKIITINIITEGELTEYLLSYDATGNLVDNLIVAYEDLVEYYTSISSKLNSSGLHIQTVNFTYDEEDDSEESDTIIIKYTLTPDLKFVVN